MNSVAPPSRRTVRQSPPAPRATLRDPFPPLAARRVFPRVAETFDRATRHALALIRAEIEI